MHNMSSLSRACIELSNSIKGFRLSRSADSTTGKDGGGGVNASTTNSVTTTTALTAPTTTSNVKTATSVTSTITRAIKSATSRVRGATTPTEQHKNGHSNLIMMMNSTMSKKWTGENPWEDESFLTKLFMYFSPCERCVLSQVCKKWKEVLYRNHIFWNSLVPVFNCKVWRTDDKGRALFYKSLEERGFNSIIVTGATDIDITEFVNNFPNSRKNIQSIALRCSNVSDAGLENMMEKMIGVNKLELAGCNEVTESAFWACLHSRIISLSISDCINVADDSVSAMAQKLPYLIELTLQAYHVTDASLSLFTAKHTYGLTVLRLISCWEITNQGIFSIVHALPNISVLSVSGCSKITDEGVELITDNLHQLKSLDLSWCPRITDAGLEYIPDLTCLEDLFLDRCCHITDTGVGYLSTMTSLLRLYLRWCTQITDFGLQHLYRMSHLQVLSLAGCHMLSATGLTGLIQMKQALQELELTNCPGSNPDVVKFLQDNMPKCLVYE